MLKKSASFVLASLSNNVKGKTCKMKRRTAECFSSETFQV